MTTAPSFAPQHVQRLVVQQFKRIEDLTIVPDAETPTVQITGRNYQGKSSVLDALETVFTGVDKRKTPKPIHEGSAAARIVAETEDLVITRTFKAKGDDATSTLTVAAKDGARYGSPQAMLDDLFGAVSVDPVEFADMEPKKQRQTLLRLVDLPFDLDALDAQRKRLYDERAEFNREAKAYTARLAAVQANIPADGAHTDEKSAGDLIERIQTAREARRALGVATDKADAAQYKVDQLKEELARAETARDLADAEVERLADTQIEDADALQAELAGLEEYNRQSRDNAQAFKESESLERLEQAALSEAAEKDLAIRDIDARKAAGLAEAKFPVAGLEFAEDGILYQGVPFEQASTAERIRVSVAVATSNPGTIRVLLVRRAESLDSENLALIGELAADAGFQVWAERVQEQRELGVWHLEDGRLAE